MSASLFFNFLRRGREWDELLALLFALSTSEYASVCLTRYTPLSIVISLDSGKVVVWLRMIGAPKFVSMAVAALRLEMRTRVLWSTRQLDSTENESAVSEG